MELKLNQNFKKIFTILGASTLMGAPLKAMNLSTPFTLESAEVLPKKIRNLTIASFSTEVTDKYNGFGTVAPIGDGFNKSITWQDLVSAQKAGYDRSSLKGYVLSKSYNMSDVVGTAHGVVDTRVTATVPVLAYGVTEKLTMALVVPIIYTNINVATGWDANQSFNAAITRFAQDGKNYRILDNKQKLDNVIVSDVASKSYAPLQNESRTDMGDITLAAKYRILKNDKWTSALTAKLVMPTGRTADVNKLVDVPTGAGIWDLGIAGTTAYEINPKLSLVSQLSYLNQLPQYMSKRIPVRSDSVATPDIDQSTYIKYGDIFGGQIGPKYKFGRMYTIGGALAYQYKAPDMASGDQYDSYRYEWLTKDTEQIMFSTHIVAGISTIALYHAHVFPVPMEINIGYANVLSGKNVNITELYSGTLALFF